MIRTLTLIALAVGLAAPAGAQPMTGMAAMQITLAHGHVRPVR